MFSSNFLGTLPGWITAIASSGGIIAWLKYLLDRKRLESDRISLLETENRKLRTDFDTYRAAAIRDFDDYRDECIRKDEEKQQLIDGLRRQMMQLERRYLEGYAGQIPPSTQTAMDKEGGK